MTTHAPLISPEGVARLTRMADQAQLKILLDQSAKERFQAILAEHKIGQNEALVALVQWWCDQNDAVRGSILGNIPASMRVDVARLALERIIESAPPPDVDVAEIGEPQAPVSRGRRRGLPHDSHT